MKINSLPALFLALTFVFSVTACTKSPDNNNKKDEQETTVPSEETYSIGDDSDYEPLLLDGSLDYGGETVTILAETFDIGYYKGELLVEDLTNEPLNDAVYNRELYVEDLLGVELEAVTVNNGKTVRENVELYYNSGDVVADIVCAPCAATMWSSQFGYYLDLSEIRNLDISSPWWSQDFIKESSFGNKVYFLTGDIAVSLFRSMFVIYYNKKIAQNNGIENVYDLVLNGTWTLDKFIELASSIYVDTNGNSACDAEDIYGFITCGMFADPLWSAFDIDIISKDEDDYITYTPNLDKLGTAFDKIYSLFTAKTTFNNNFHLGVEYITGNFASDTGLFASSYLAMAETETMRNMQSEYGIIPIPKYDEAQEGYYTMSHDQYSVFGMMASMDRTRAERAAAVLEAMGWYGYRYITPTYMNVVMKGKYANDTETRQMLDIIKDGLKIDTAWIYAYYLDSYPQGWRYMLIDNDNNYSSVFSRKERNMKILVKALNDAYRSIAEN